MRVEFQNHPNTVHLSLAIWMILDIFGLGRNLTVDPQFLTLDLQIRGILAF